MPAPSEFAYRSARPGDELCLGVLATQVFLDTYATHGVNADLAREALNMYSPASLAARIHNPHAEITVIESKGNLVGFLDLSLQGPCPVLEIAGPQVLRLYVQAPFQRRGLGRSLLGRAEARARTTGARFIWLTAWSGNAGALAFYPAAGYEDVGVTQYVIEGKNYENRVFAKSIAAGEG